MIFSVANYMLLSQSVWSQAHDYNGPSPGNRAAAVVRLWQSKVVSNKYLKYLRGTSSKLNPTSLFRMMWSAGVVAALGSITYPAISAFVSLYAAPESQGK